MKLGWQFKLGKRSRLASWLAVLALVPQGCSSFRPAVNRALVTDSRATARNSDVAENYLVQCPDVLEITVMGRPDLTGLHPIGTDGRIPLADVGRLRVEGKNPSEAARLVSAASDIPPEQVQVRVAEFRSQQVYLYGQVIGLQRSVPYQGPETVLDVLQRVGGITPGAATNDVYLIRPRIAEGKQPEVFPVDLRAILVHNDHKTNLRLQPFDLIYVGETRRSSLEKCVPPWLKPFYEAICGLRRESLAVPPPSTGLPP